MAVDALDAVVDKGEAETIILAKEMNIKQVLMDDKKGVNLAKKMGLEPLRATTIIGIAYKNGLLSGAFKSQTYKASNWVKASFFLTGFTAK